MNQDDESAVQVLGSEQWVESFEDEVYQEARDAVLDNVEQIERLDSGNRKLAWSSEDALSFDNSVLRICSAYPTLPAALIRSHRFVWPEQGELPGDLSDEEMEKLDALMEPSIDEL